MSSSGSATSERGIFVVTDFGAKGDLTTNDTAAINAAINAAAVHGGTVLFPYGNYICDNLITPDFVKFEGEGGNSTRFTATSYYLDGNRRATTALHRVSGSNNPLVTISGYGSSIANFELQGDGATDNAALVVQSGFETTLDNVRIINVANIGLDVQKADNTHNWSDIFIDNCGTSSLPAMRIWSNPNVGGATLTNTFDIDGLTIERSENVALDIAYNPSNPADSNYWAEFVRISRLHIESNSQNARSGANVGNTDPLIRIGNIRSLHLDHPFVYGGPGVLIQHDQQYTKSYGNGGVKIVNGSFLGSDTSTGVSASTNLFSLVNGDDFSLDASRWFRSTNSAITIASTYGADVRIGRTNYPDPVTMTDNRTSPSNYTMNGTTTLAGHLLSTGTAPTPANGTGVTGTSLLSGSTDSSGVVFFGTTASPAAGLQVQLTFAQVYGRQPTVILTPGNAATAALGLYVGAATNFLKIYASNAPAASQGNTAYQVNYTVIG